MSSFVPDAFTATVSAASETMIYLAIVGSRNLHDESFFKKHVELWIAQHGQPSFIVSGGAAGTDTLAARFANESKMPLIEYEAQWKKHGKAAGPIRNSAIVNKATHVLAFPSRTGRGTQDTMRKAIKAKKPLVVQYID